MDARMLELVVLGLSSALLCGVAIAAQHGLATAVFAGLAAGIGLIAAIQKIAMMRSGRGSVDVIPVATASQLPRLAEPPVALPAGLRQS